LKPILFLFYLFFQLICLVQAQLDSLSEIFTDQLTDDRGLSEILEQLMESPLAINSASREELESLPFLSSNQIDSILIKRPFRAKSEIRNILGQKTFQLFKHFFTLEDKKASLNVHVIHRLKFQLEKNIGIKNKIYTGSPLENYNRIQIQKEDYLSLGIINHKDTGEEHFTDHVAGYIQWYDRKNGRKLLLGNYQINFGEGLAFSSPYLFLNSADAIMPLQFKNPTGKPYLSVTENKGFNGFYLSYNFMQDFQIVGFYSNNLKDAQIDEETGRLTGIGGTGYHRTAAEKQCQNVLKERSFGFMFTFFRENAVFLGLVINRTNYSPPIFFQYSESNKINNIDLHSISYMKKWGKIIFSGEIASNDMNSYAQQHGFLISEDQWNFGIKWWDLPYHYGSPYGENGSGDFTFWQNERGLYIGIAGAINDYFNLNAYVNYQKDLWRTFFNPMPGWKQEYSLQLNWKYNQPTDILLRYIYINNLFSPAELNKNVIECKNKIRLQIDRKVSSRIYFKTRIEKIFLNYSYLFDSKQGINLYHDVCFKLSSHVKIISRFSSFKTSDYDSRIYEYESDIPGIFANRPLYGKGNKWYLLIKYSPWNDFHLWFKYSKIYFADVAYLGSGNDKIENDTKQAISIQLNYNL
jgi:hypothetical protein